VNKLEEHWDAAPGLALSTEAVGEFVRICVKNSEYDFVHGRPGTSYVDVDELFGPNEGDASLLEELINAAATKINQLAVSEGYNLLGFVDGRRGPAGALCLRTQLAQKTGLESVILRPYKRLLSQAIKPFRVGPQSRVLLVTDVATTGRNVVDAATLLWRVGSRRCGAITIANRNEGALERLHMMGIPLSYVVQPSLSAAV
jgi:hypothetical protein